MGFLFGKHLMNGYIKLHRQLLDNPIWTCERFSKGQAWVDLLLLANHKDNKIIKNGRFDIVKRGQVMTSIHKLSARWSWSVNTVKTFLNLLESDNMIQRRSDSVCTVIDIVNYQSFQGLQEFKNTPTDTPVNTPTDTRTAHGLTPNNNDNNVNNDNNLSREETTHTFGVYGNVYLTDGELKELIKQYPDDYKDMIENLSFYMRSRGKRYDDHFATMMRWKHDDEKKQATKNYDYRKDVK